MAERAEQIAATLRTLGVEVSSQARPDIDFQQSLNVYVSLLQGVMAESVLGEDRAQIQAGVAALDPDDASMEAAMARGAIQDHATWMASHNERYLLRKQWRAFFADWDILICPQMATTAFAHDHGDPMGRSIAVDNVVQPYFQQLFWAGSITVAHLPSTVFPTGPSAQGLPIGLQAVGAEFNDYVTIEFTRLLAQEIGGFVAPPAYA